MIHKMVVTPKQTLVIHFLDSSTYWHRLGHTPRGTRLYNSQRGHSLIHPYMPKAAKPREFRSSWELVSIQCEHSYSGT